MTEVEVLPPEVHQKVNALETLDAEAQARAVTAMLSHSRTGLLAAVAAQDLPLIVEFKAKASAIHEISKQLRLGKDMQADAAEFLRRAERGLGVAIREGQANGTVAKRGDIGGNRSTPVPDLVKTTGLATKGELHGRGGEKHTGIYAMTDGGVRRVTSHGLRPAALSPSGRALAPAAHVPSTPPPSPRRFSCPHFAHTLPKTPGISLPCRGISRKHQCWSKPKTAGPRYRDG